MIVLYSLFIFEEGTRGIAAIEVTYYFGVCVRV